MKESYTSLNNENEVDYEIINRLRQMTNKDQQKTLDFINSILSE